MRSGVYAGLLSMKYYSLFKADPAAFRSGFLGLLKNGFDAPPDALLKRFLGIDLRDPTLVTDMVTILQGKLAQFESIGR
jgi:oligoendopeptidase F